MGYFIAFLIKEISDLLSATYKNEVQSKRFYVFA